MKINLNIELLPWEQQRAVYSALFQMAYADKLLLSAEIEFLSASLGDLDSRPLEDRIRFESIIRSPDPISHSLSVINAGFGDLSGIVYVLLLDMALSDGFIVSQEIELLDQAYKLLSIERCDQQVLVEICDRLNRIATMHSRASDSSMRWAEYCLARLIKIRSPQTHDTVDPQQIERPPRVPSHLPLSQPKVSGRSAVGCDGEDLLDDFFSVLKHQKLKRRIDALAE